MKESDMLTGKAGSAPSTGLPILKVEGVRAGYGDIAVLRDISLTLQAGKLELVLGRNGVGKTTLLSTIAGLLPCWSGKLIFNGTDISDRPPYRRSRQGVVLVQEGKRIFHRQSVAQNILLGAIGKRLSRAERADLVSEMLELFPALKGRERERAGALSGGQQQMVAIAQALAARPALLMLDEPSAGLAPVIVTGLFSRLAGLRDNGLTILLVEQLADKALAIADHVSVLNGGVIVAAGRADEFQDREVLSSVYFAK